MRSKTLKRCIIVLSSVVILAFAYQRIIGCGWGDSTDIPEFSMFTPKVIEQPQFEPFFLTYEDYYPEGSYETSNDSINIQEWKKYFKDVVQSYNIEWLVYHSSIQQIEQLKNYFVHKTALPDSITKYHDLLLTELSSVKNVEGCFDYLNLAKKIEVATATDWDSWRDPSHDTITGKALINDGMKLFNTTKDPFLKKRSGFQLMRLYHYTGDFETGNSFYDKQLSSSSSSDRNSIYYRSLGYKAGCLYRMREYAEANYIYSLLYDQYEPMRISAFWGFHPWEDSDWNQSLALAKTTREKEVLWHLFGIYADPFKGMKEIYTVNPSSNLINLLIVRAVNIREWIQLQYISDHNYLSEKIQLYLGDDVDRVYNSAASWTSIDSLQALELATFLETIGQDKKLMRPDIALAAAAYLNFLHNKYDHSLQIVKQAERKTKSDPVKLQLKVIAALDEIALMKTISNKQESKLAELINGIIKDQTLVTQNAVKYIMMMLGEKYRAQNDSLKSELCFGGKGEFPTEKLIPFLERKDLSNFEKFLADRYPFKLKHLYERMAIDLMYENRFEEAITIFEKNSESGAEILPGNPFTIHISDCHDCDHVAPQKTKYSKYDFCKKMVELKTKAESSQDSLEKAQNYFLFANGLYNMTWYGNARNVYYTYIYNWTGEPYYYSGNDRASSIKEDQPFYDCAPALEYYELAASLASKKELAAKCTWMCAKCEQNIGEYESEINQSPGAYFVAGKYFNAMKDKYSDTKYYQDVIKECGYFCTFNGGGMECIRNKE